MRVFTPAALSLASVIRALVATFLALAAPLVVDFVFIVVVGWRLSVGVNEPLARGVPVRSVLLFHDAWPSQSHWREGNSRKRAQRVREEGRSRSWDESHGTALSSIEVPVRLQHDSHSCTRSLIIAQVECSAGWFLKCSILRSNSLTMVSETGRSEGCASN
jgi:hypothetical protein